MRDIDNEIDELFRELKELQNIRESAEIEKKLLIEKEAKERLKKIEEIRKANQLQIDKGKIAYELFMRNLFFDENNAYNAEDLGNYYKLNPSKIKVKKRVSSEEKKKINAEKEAAKLRKKKIDFLNKVLSKRDKFSSLIDFNDNIQWMLTKRLVEVNEIIDYSGKVIAVGKRIEFGAEGYFYVFDNRDNSFNLFKYDFENKTLQHRFSTNSEEELKAEIEKEDPGSRYGFKYRYYQAQNKINVVEPSKEEIKEELERKHKEEMEEFDRLFGTTEETKPNNTQDSIDDEFEKLFGS